MQRVLISGSSGLVGTALRHALAQRSVDVVRLVRDGGGSRGGVSGNNQLRSEEVIRIDEVGKLDGTLDAVVNLAGENIGSGDGAHGPLRAIGRWNEAKKQRIMRSRQEGTEALAKAVAAFDKPPALFLSASAVGFYGQSRAPGVERQVEGDERGSGFLADVADAWESATAPAAAAGMRVALMRFGVVLAAADGMLAKLRLPFMLGGGGRLGSGEQHMSWIELSDAVRAILHCMDRTTLSGPVNVCAPVACTNAAFTAALAANVWPGSLCAPTVFTVPEAVVRGVWGEMGVETMLADQVVYPQRLLDTGFSFESETIEQGVKAALAM